MLRCTLLLLLVVLPAYAQTSPMLEAIRSRDWGAARLLAATPLGVKLVDFIRLLAPEQANASEILAFLQSEPSWPDHPALEQRYGEALVREGDETDVARLCDRHSPAAAGARVRCAEAYALANQQPKADALARAAWIAGITQPDEEVAFLARWGKVLTCVDQIRRFAHLLGDSGAAIRQLARMSDDQRRLGDARLAFRRLDPAALSYFTAVPESLRGDPSLLFDQARYFRRMHEEDAAAALWRGALGATEASRDPVQRAAFWAERDTLARALMAAGAVSDAYAVAVDPGLPADKAQESAFLAGWIALEGLRDKALARQYFSTLQASSHAAISRARAAFWLGRAAVDRAAAQAAFEAGSAWPLTYYGQRAALAAGVSEADLRTRIAALRDPDLAPGAAAQVQDNTLFKAAQLLVGWQDPRRAVDFFLRLLEPPASQPERQVVAEAALADGLPEVAVMAARLIGKDGGALPISGWPSPVRPPKGAVPQALIMAVMRQESGFDTAVTSAAGAQGLMQLMPGTAQELARSNHIAAGPLSDAAVNMRLGSVYLASLLKRFRGVVPFAIAAYDAGPHRVQQWLDVAHPDVGDEGAMIDWIEAIPFAETRNYVQRVLENDMVYEAKSGH